MPEDKPAHNRDFFATVLKRFELAQEAEQETRRLALEDLKFLSGEQWPDQIKKQRESEGRPCLTINRLPQYLRQVTNEERQNRQAIQINPVSEGADEETAEIIEGLVRHIEYDSAADVAYDTAFEFAASTGGPGWVRVDTEYEQGESGPQVIKINRVRNPFIVYDDPSAQRADRSDSKWRFFVENLTKDEYSKEYQDSELASLDDWASTGDMPPGWLSDNSVRIAEYFEVEEDAEGKKQVHWYKLNAVEVLDETVIPCQYIPSAPVFGDEREIDGKLVFSGIVRDSKDSQRMYNYFASKEAEAVALAPNAPFIGWTGQFEGQEQKWATANTKNWAFLEANPVIVNGQPAPSLPQRNVAEPAIQAINQSRMASAEDLNATTGIYPAQLGDISNEVSGKAVLARQQQGHISNLHYYDNLKRTIRLLGRIVLELIPHIYDTKRIIRIIGEEGDQKVVTVNHPFDVNGVRKVYDLTVGKYDVTIDSGPSFQTRRQEAVQSIMALVQAQPALVNVCGDLLVKMMDWPMHEEVAERLKKLLPPALQDNDGTPEAMLAQSQAQLQALGQQHQMLTQALQQAQQVINSKQVEMQARKEIELFKAQKEYDLKVMTLTTQRDIAEIQTKAQDVRERVKLDAALDVEQHVSAHELGMQAHDQAHQRDMAERQAEMMQQQAQLQQQNGSDQQGLGQGAQ